MQNIPDNLGTNCKGSTSRPFRRSGLIYLCLQIMLLMSLHDTITTSSFFKYRFSSKSTDRACEIIPHILDKSNDVISTLDHSQAAFLQRQFHKDERNFSSTSNFYINITSGMIRRYLFLAFQSSQSSLCLATHEEPTSTKKTEKIVSNISKLIRHALRKISTLTK